jgi:hypothetical protein
LTVTAIAPVAVFWLVETLAMELIVGAVFCALTVTTNVLVVETLLASVAVTVIAVAPV